MVECPYCGGQTDWLTPTRVALLLEVAEGTVRRWCREGRLGAERVHGFGASGIWRIPSTAVIPIIEAKGGTGG